MSERVWHKGPPPHVGWWNASVIRVEENWRWWEAGEWSNPAYFDEPPEVAADIATHVSPEQSAIEWTDYWPENARVPRLDPTGGHWTFNVDGSVPETGENIEVAYRGGLVIKRKSFDLMGADWRLDGGGCDILAWRPAA